MARQVHGLSGPLTRPWETPPGRRPGKLPEDNAAWVQFWGTSKRKQEDHRGWDVNEWDRETKLEGEQGPGEADTEDPRGQEADPAGEDETAPEPWACTRVLTLEGRRRPWAAHACTIRCFLAVGLGSTPLIAELSAGEAKRAGLKSPPEVSPMALPSKSALGFPRPHPPTISPNPHHEPPSLGIYHLMKVFSLSNLRATLWLKPTLHFYIPVNVTLSTLDLTAWSPSLLTKCHGN